MDLKNHDGTKKIAKNGFSGLILKYLQSIDLYEISHGHCNYLEFKFVNS